MIIHRFLGLFVILSITEAGESSSWAPHARIWNGTEITLSDYPFFAQLEIFKAPQRSACSGSIISNGWILTAAHCTYGGDQINVTTARFFTAATRWFMHPLYYDERHDIALIQIPERKHPLPILLLPLPGQDEQILDSGNQVHVIGRGRIEMKSHDNETSIHGLREAVGTLSHYTCDQTFDRIWGGICMNHDSPFTFLICAGDSGGPHIVGDARAYIVLGVSQSVLMSCITERFDLFEKQGVNTKTYVTRVSSQIHWLLHTIDAQSKNHRLESTMNLWMSDAHMPQLFP